MPRTILRILHAFTPTYTELPMFYPFACFQPVVSELPVNPTNSYTAKQTTKQQTIHKCPTLHLSSSNAGLVPGAFPRRPSPNVHWKATA